VLDEALIARHEPRLRDITRRFRLTPAQADDAIQNTWLRLLTATLRDPDALPFWLATTARRECLHLLQAHVREFPSDDPALGERVHAETPEDVLLAAERRAVVGRALAALPARRRALMRLLAAEEDYHEVSEQLAMPVGSIGPTRARALEQLRGNRELLELQRAA
jgi:RNA polymerase sigma factor (sigma-70 family)